MYCLKIGQWCFHFLSVLRWWSQNKLYGEGFSCKWREIWLHFPSIATFVSCKPKCLSASFSWSHFITISKGSWTPCARTFRLPNFDSSQGPNTQVSWLDGSEGLAIHTESTQDILQLTGDLLNGLAVQGQWCFQAVDFEKRQTRTAVDGERTLFQFLHDPQH